MTARRVVIAGGSGFLGQCFAKKLLAAGCEVDVLTRSPGPNILGRAVAWDGSTVGDWARVLEGAAAVVNLTGKSVKLPLHAFQPTGNSRVSIGLGGGAWKSAEQVHDSAAGLCAGRVSRHLRESWSDVVR